MHPSDHEKWQTLYPAAESNWGDLGRIANLIIPFIFLGFIVIMYILAGFIYINWDVWASTRTTTFSVNLLVFLILLLVFIPLFLMAMGLRFISRQAREVVKDLYQPNPKIKLPPLMRRKLLGVPPFPPPLSKMIKYPFVVFHEPALKEEDEWVRWFGGPAILVIHDGTALYLERGNKFSRVVGPGAPMPLLERHERVAEVVDLRPQTKTGKIDMWTKDGIHITLSLKVEVQILASPKYIERSSNLRYPFDPLAVKSAVETALVGMMDGKLQERGWLESAWGIISGEVSAFVAGHSLDELFLAPQDEGGLRSANHKSRPTEEIEQILSPSITEQVINSLQGKLQGKGVRVLNIQVTEITVPKEVQDLRTQHWESIREIISAQRNSRAEAERIRVRDEAHAEAQRTILMTIIQKLENIDADVMTEPLILSLSNILDQGLEDPMIRPWIANESLNVLERMRKLLKERF
jgi:hypothetical protein